MRLFKGFLMSKDPETGKLSPFFLKVRNEDIFVSKKISLDKTFHQTSGLWTVEKEMHSTDMSIFVYSMASGIATAGEEISHNEKSPANGFSGKILYKVYKSGYYEVQCMFNFVPLNNDIKSQSVIVVPLPYDVKNVLNITPYMTPIYSYNKSTAGMIINLGKSKIENDILSINDSEEYMYKLELVHVWNMYMSSEYGSGLNPCNNDPHSLATIPFVSFTINGFVDKVLYE